MPRTGGHSWRFKTRFRRHAFGWKSQPAITRLQEALSEIKQVARLEPLFAAEGAIAQNDVLWSYKRWAVKAMAAQGRGAEAIAYAERCRSPWASDTDIDGLCEQILLASGHPEEAYARYAISANRAATYLGWYRAVAKKYPNKPPAVVLADLVRHKPGEEGKWFAAAKDAKLFDEAVALANATPCDPKTLTQAARDFAQTNPAFAVEAGLAALRWLVQGYGYEITTVDVRAAYSYT